MPKVNQPDATPTRKVTAASTAAAVVVVLVWVVHAATGVEVPAEVAAALTTLVAFAAGYLTREDVA